MSQSGKGVRALLWIAGSLVVLVAGAVVITVYPGLQAARWDRTQMNIRDLESTLRDYARGTGHYPGIAEGFRPLLATGVLAAEPYDAWGRPYHYALVEGRPVITSFGSDGRPGGVGPDEDISNLSPRSYRTELRTR